MRTVLVVLVVAAVTAVNAGIVAAPQTSILCRQLISANSSLAIWSEHHQAVAELVARVVDVGVAPVPVSGLLVQTAGHMPMFAAQVETMESVDEVAAL